VVPHGSPTGIRELRRRQERGSKAAKGGVSELIELRKNAAAGWFRTM
jgi:hypothetical protein